MMTWVLVLMAMLVVVGAMSIGVLMGRKPIAGSCGGLNTLGLKQGCDICGGNDDACKAEQRRVADANGTPGNLAIDATRKR